MDTARTERNTAQKRYIIEGAHCLDHPSAEELYDWVRAYCPKISRATVYRNVLALVQKGELKRLDTLTGPDRYDVTLAPHYHAICTRCGAVHDVQLTYMPQMDAVTDENFTIEGHELIFKGVCKDCREKIETE